MKPRIKILSLLVCFCLAAPIAWGQVRHEIQLPDIPGYRTLKCDFHMHTVFSDGVVWPTVRVDEAWRQGLDVIAVTDHIEYQPHKGDIPTQHNRPYQIVAGRAKERDLLCIRGAEITRDTPPGHFNAIFLHDVEPLDTEDFLECVKQANEQKAFVFWNHHAWKGEEKGKWLDVHTTMYDNKWLHGMEVCNGSTYYPSAHAWCLEKNLTLFGNSDIHDPDLRLQSTPQDHRTLTLVFAKERTLEAVQEALRAGRTAVWFDDQLIGRADYLEPLFHACLEVHAGHHRYKNTVYCTMTNRSDVDLNLRRQGRQGPQTISLPAGTTGLVKFTAPADVESVTLSYEVTNYLIAPNQSLPVQLTIKLP
ncbi:MAG: hypothetical protein JW810_08145 [Sedimentisphaerales bacterium]|nr:hypothetical protein [Sedimentisphaerales bacterium]